MNFFIFEKKNIFKEGKKEEVLKKIYITGDW